MPEINFGEIQPSQITVGVENPQGDTEFIHPHAVETKGNKLTVEFQFRLPEHIKGGNIRDVVNALERQWMTLKDFNIHDITVKKADRQSYHTEDGNTFALQVAFDIRRVKAEDPSSLDANLTAALFRVQIITSQRHGEGLHWVQ